MEGAGDDSNTRPSENPKRSVLYWQLVGWMKSLKQTVEKIN
jgi:hypothetical protein